DRCKRRISAQSSTVITFLIISRGGQISDDATGSVFTCRRHQNALSTEGRAGQICQYQSILVPGLLQTPDYAEVLVRAWQPRASDDEVEQVVQTRTGRLPNLLDRKPSLWFVVDEVVITRPVGSHQIMAAQLEHIADLAESGSIRFQILPQRLIHPGMCPPFRLMTLADGQAVVFVEHALGDEARSSVDDVSQMRLLFGAMQADALAPSQSIQRLREIGKELK
uniref:DUF5753 domain-containing protein n=1 Tax=Nocardiopsis sp. FR26 TaxID=2605987 RepID=UPI001F257A33